jgi:hypothetical protein
MRLVYWLATRVDDSSAYSFRTRTRAECYAALRKEWGTSASYLSPRKIIVEYEDALDLVKHALGEGGIE